MDERWQEIERVFHAARELEKSARAEYLVQARTRLESALSNKDLRRSVLVQ